MPTEYQLRADEPRLWPQERTVRAVIDFRDDLLRGWLTPQGGPEDG